VALLSRPSGAADAVHVILDVIRQIKINDQLDIFDINTPGCDIRGDEYTVTAGLKALDGLFSLAHGAVGMYLNRSVIGLIEKTGHFPRFDLRAYKE